MRTQSACYFLIGLSLFLAGCGKCCETSAPSTPSSSSVSTESAAPTCCDIEPTRAVVLANAAEVDLKSVKLSELQEAIKAQAGKIVVMDVWGTFCVPCKKEFPRLVKLHEEHAKDGLVCMSLSIDDKEDRAAALDFLKTRHATFANFLIDEPAMVWQNHFLLKGVPAVFIWDRAGKQVARFDGDDPDNQFTYAQVEKKVAELLQTK
jgi:thiol-disulfide isomerase/thioredoxin